MDSFSREYEKVLSEIKTSHIGRTFDELKNSFGDRPLVLYGAGRMAGLILEYCGGIRPAGHLRLRQVKDGHVRRSAHH
jgi:hypothetical protein